MLPTPPKCTKQSMHRYKLATPRRSCISCHQRSEQLSFLAIFKTQILVLNMEAPLKEWLVSLKTTTNKPNKNKQQKQQKRRLILDVACAARPWMSFCHWDSRLQHPLNAINEPSHTLWVFMDPWWFMDDPTFPVGRGSLEIHGVNEQANVSHVSLVHKDQWCVMNMQSIACVHVTSSWQFLMEM